MKPNWREYRDLLFRYLTGLWPKVLILAFGLLLQTGAQLGGPLVVRRFIDAVGEGATLERLTSIALIMLGVAAVNTTASLTVSYMSGDVGWRATNRLRSDLVRHSLRLDMPFHQARTPGEMTERIDGDVNQLTGFFSEFLVSQVNNVLLLGSILVILFSEDWRAALPIALFGILSTLGLTRMFSFAIPYWTKAREAMTDLLGYIGERLSGTEEIRANGATGYVMRGYWRLAGEYYRVLRKAALAGASIMGGFTLASNVGIILAMGLGGWLFLTGRITLGTTYLLIQYSEMLNRPLQGIVQQFQVLGMVGALINRLKDMLGEKSAVVDGPGTPLPDGPLAVDLTGVDFGYTADDRVLKGIDIHLAPGQVLGLLGRTGSGKTTITRLLTRLYDPQAGGVYLGHIDIRETRLADLRQRVAIVTQEVQLFEATIRENLALFNPYIADDRITAALEEVGLGDWLRAQPKGLDTVLPAGGGGLSAGEAQLIAFARGFLKDPGLVILDEPSSRLDPATERRIGQAMSRLLAGRTAIVIAHRLETVDRADEILIVDGGSVLEHGARPALAANESSHFHRLLRAGQVEEVLA